MFATFLGFWAAASIVDLVFLGALIVACLFSSAGILWRWEKGGDGDPGWAYVWLVAIFVTIATYLASGDVLTVRGFVGALVSAGTYLLEYLAAGLVYALGLLVWTFVRGRSALAELTQSLFQNYGPLLSRPCYSTLRSYTEIQDESNDSTLFAKYFFGYNAFFKLKEGFNVVEAHPENLFKLKVEDVSVQTANVLCFFLNNMFLWAALLPARIFKDWLVDFGRWVVGVVSKFGLNYVKSALKA